MGWVEYVILRASGLQVAWEMNVWRGGEMRERGGSVIRESGLLEEWVGRGR